MLFSAPVRVRQLQQYCHELKKISRVTDDATLPSCRTQTRGLPRELPSETGGSARSRAIISYPSSVDTSLPDANPHPLGSGRARKRAVAEGVKSAMPQQLRNASRCFPSQGSQSRATIGNALKAGLSVCLSVHRATFLRVHYRSREAA